MSCWLMCVCFLSWPVFTVYKSRARKLYLLLHCQSGTRSSNGTLYAVKVVLLVGLMRVCSMGGRISGGLHPSEARLLIKFRLGRHLCCIEIN